MFINQILNYMQNYFYNFYIKSFILQNLDWLIFTNIILVILTSVFLPSDNIAYFAIFTIILISIKFIVKKGEQFKLINGDLLLLIFFLITLISLAGSTMLDLSFKGFLKTLIYLGFYISLVHFFKYNKNLIKYIFLTIFLMSLIESVIAIQQNFLCVSEISGWQDVTRLNSEQIMTRVYGSLKPYNPNLFGGYLLAILPATLIAILLPLKNNFSKFFYFGMLAFILNLISLFLTGCRGAYVGLFVEILFLVIITYKILKPIYKKTFLYMMSILSLFSTFIIFTLPKIKARIFSIFAMRADSSNSFRFNVYNSCWEMLKDNWLLGIGIGNQNFREIYGLYMKTGFDALSAYNIYLEIAVESGIFALISFLMFLYYKVKKSIQYIWKHKNIKTIYLIIATTSIIGILAHGLVDTVFFRPQIQFIFWIMMSIISVLTIKESRYSFDK